MTNTDPIHVLRHILAMIETDVPKAELIAAANEAANALAFDFFEWARNRDESDIFGTEVFFEDTPEDRMWVTGTDGDDDVDLICEDGTVGGWDRDQPGPLLVRPGGTRLAVPPPETTGPWTVRTVAELDELPVGSVVSADRSVWIKTLESAGWQVAGESRVYLTVHVAREADRFTVLREGWSS